MERGEMAVFRTRTEGWWKGSSLRGVFKKFSSMPKAVCYFGLLNFSPSE